MSRGKSRRASKNARNHKGEIQYARTVKRTGRWRGKPGSKYIKYVKPKKVIEFFSEFIHYKKYGNK